jgi:uncharacterized protein YndB with AHSA1/START domain
LAGGGTAGVDGSEWISRVLAWQPPHRLVVTWQINGEWQFDPDPAHASEIEVRFTADGPTQTTVDLEHRHLDRLVRVNVPTRSPGRRLERDLGIFAKRSQG